VDVTADAVRDLRSRGVGYVPGDRQRFGLILNFPLDDNLVLTQYDRPPFARGIVRNEQAVRDWAEEAIRSFDIRTLGARVQAGTLSGGNQQKAVVAREFSRDLLLLVLDQPTRGLDVGSIEFIHRQAIRKRDAGTAILLVSSELDEVLELSDRVAIMFRGQVVSIVDGPTASREEVGLLMATGGRQPVVAAP
jgi:general nucleoside transport system ATP-binding protein